VHRPCDLRRALDARDGGAELHVEIGVEAAADGKRITL